MKITIKLLDQNDLVKIGVLSYDKIPKPYEVSGEDLAVLGIKNLTWRLGEKIQVTLEKPGQYVWVQLDETLAPTLLYIKGKRWIYTIVPNKRQIDTAFVSGRHCIMVRTATEAEIKCYRNLALNPHDQIADTNAFPHAVSNVSAETNPVFFAQNAIDGKLANLSHGSYPFGSWGIHNQDDAALTIEFGRKVKLDTLKFLFRSDNLERPHDSYWEHVTVDFTNGEQMTFNTDNSDNLQSYNFKPQITDRIVLKNLEKADDNVPFVALTQIEAYGYNI